MEIGKSPMCRVCLNNYDSAIDIEFINLFVKYNGKLVNEKISYIVNINIKQGDGLPDKICLPCVQSLEAAYSFKRTCEESDNILRSALKEAPDEQAEIQLKEEAQENEDYEFDSSDVKLEYEFTKLDKNNDHGTDSEVVEGPEQSDTPRPSRAIDLHLECHDCGGFFKSKCKLRVHWKKEHMPSQLICPNCKKTYKTYKALHSHIKQKTKQCMFVSKLKIEGVGKSRIFHCSECDYSAKIAEYVMQHYVQHSGEKRFTCELCGKTYTWLNSLIEHKERTHKTRIIEMTCDLCGKHVVGRNNVYRHQKSHKSPNQFPCEICKKVVRSKTSLAGHMKRHGNVKDESCDICQKTFYTRAEVYHHQEKVHIRSKFYTCDRCSFETWSYSTIKKHKKGHTDTNIPCEICWKFVENVQQLKGHMLRHDRKIQCMHCDSKFLTQKNVRDHLRAVHGIRQGRKKKVKKSYFDSD